MNGVAAMNQSEDQQDLEARNPVEVLVEEYLQQRRKGRGQTVEQFARHHPEHAAELSRLLPTIAAMERLKTRVGFSSGRPVELRVERLEQLGDYRIIREIGRGGMGIVYEAEQQSLGRHVAVKVFSRDTLGDSRHLHRFERERARQPACTTPTSCQCLAWGSRTDCHTMSCNTSAESAWIT